MSTTTVKPSCPRCGYSNAWDGASCARCRYPQPAPGPLPRPDDPELRGPAFLKDPIERGFLQAICEDPDDETARLIYADWLEERGDARGELLRSESRLASLPRDDPDFLPLRARCERLAMGVDRLWYLVVEGMPRRSRILNCGAAGAAPAEVRFVFRCPNRWNAPRPTAEAGVRYCEDCRRDVYHCDTPEQARQHAVADHCLAITSRLAAEVGSGPTAQEDSEDELPLHTRPNQLRLPMVEDNNDRFRGWWQELIRPPETRKRWWQFWR